ncbi:hypothetical protein F5I97DRAFT_1021469 [Phlebopus sp. FC_14]|nr:hypothetical protein F5I97DRAFT_1021469 [Phlebopus sp. FC_14]
MASSVRRALTLFMIVVLLLRSCYALSGDAGFSWRFENRGLDGSTLMECETLAISISPSNGNSSNVGMGPYYLLAFEPSGTSTTTLLGHTPSSLRWQVTHSIGSQLLLSLVDSQGTSGGVHPMLFTVKANTADRECLYVDPLSSPLSPLKPEIVSSVIGQIPPCGAWDLSVFGGRAPYTISVVSLGSSTVYNFSLPLGQQSFTYNNRGGISGRMVGSKPSPDVFLTLQSGAHAESI